MSQNGVQDIVAVGKDVSAYEYAIADGALDGEPSTIDLGLDILDDDSAGVCRRDDAVLFTRHSRYQPPSLSSRPSIQTGEVLSGTCRGEKTLIFGLFLKFITCHG